MNKKKFLLILLSATAVLSLSAIVLSKSPAFTKNEGVIDTQTPTLAPTDYQAKVIISAPEENFSVEYDAITEKTYQPFSLLEEALDKNNIPIEIETYDFGVFVKSINGLKSTNEKAWIYFVNGESGQVAADKMDLEKGDIVEWKYITPSM